MTQQESKIIDEYSAVTITAVRFEHCQEALGIGASRPRLSWMVETASTGWCQIGYEIGDRLETINECSE